MKAERKEFKEVYLRAATGLLVFCLVGFYAIPFLWTKLAIFEAESVWNGLGILIAVFGGAVTGRWFAMGFPLPVHFFCAPLLFILAGLVSSMSESRWKLLVVILLFPFILYLPYRRNARKNEVDEV